MRIFRAGLAALLALALLFAAAGCGKAAEPSLVGTWEFTDADNALNMVYVLNEDGTGTYTMTVGGQDTTYELKYEAKDGHLLVTYVNNEIFTEDDVFDNEIRFKNADTLIIKDSFGEEGTYLRRG